MSCFAACALIAVHASNPTAAQVTLTACSAAET